MSLARIDVSAYDDTELGALVRHAFAEGHGVVWLFDASRPDDRAGVWVDGLRGLYKRRCSAGHVWLSATMAAPGVGGGAREFVQQDCPSCGRAGESVGE